MTRCVTKYIQTPLGLADDLRQARKDIQDYKQTLYAILARYHGEFDGRALLAQGPLSTDTASDMARFAGNCLNRHKETGI